MKFYLAAFLLVGWFSWAYSQRHLTSDERSVVEKALSDKENFRIMRGLSRQNKIPEKILLEPKSAKWNSYRFKLTGRFQLSDTIRLQRPSKATVFDGYSNGWGDKPDHQWSGIEVMKYYEHHPYNHTYIFKYPVLDSLFNDVDKEELYQQAIKQDSFVIDYKSKFVEVAFLGAKEEFHIRVTRPIFSLDKKKAAIEIGVWQNSSAMNGNSLDYYGAIFIVYIRDKNSYWKRFKIIDRVIL